MSKSLPALTLIMFVAVTAIASGGPAVAGVIYQFRGGIIDAEGDCGGGDCTVDGWMDVSTEAFEDRHIDDPTDLNAFNFTVSERDGTAYRFELADLASACGLDPCIDLTVGLGGVLLTDGLLAARHVLAGGALLAAVPSDEFSIVLQDTDGDGAWSGTARSDKPPAGVLSLTGVWLRDQTWVEVPAPGALSLLLAGLAAIGVLGRRRAA